MATVVQRSFAGGEIAPTLHGRADLERYGSSCKSLLNMIVTRHGSPRKRPGMEYVDVLAVKTGVVRLVDFVYSSEQSYILVVYQKPTDGVTRGRLAIYRDGARLTGSGDPAWDNQKTYEAHEYVDYLGTRYVSLAATFQNTPSSSPTYWEATTELYLDHDYEAAELAELQWAQVGDVLTIVHPDHAPLEVVREGVGRWTTRVPQLPLLNYESGNYECVTGVAVSSSPLSAGAGTDWVPAEAWTWIVTVVRQVGGEWVEDSNYGTVGGTYAFGGNLGPIGLEWGGVYSSGVYYRIYRGRNGVYGLVGESDSAAFVDQGLSPDLSKQPPAPLDDDATLFAVENTYPSALGFYEQRMVFGGTRDLPHGLWFSRAGELHSFSRNPYLVPPADNGLSLKLAATQYERVRAFATVAGRLVVLSSAGEWEMGYEGELSAATVGIRKHSSRGSGTLRPLVVGNTVLFVSDNGRAIYELSYDGQASAWASRDLTILASHLFEGRRIVDWCYQQHPESIVWCVLDDGALVSLTYSRDVDLVAWTHHATVGEVRGVAAVPEDGVDVVYLAVERMLVDKDSGTTTVLTLERMVDRGRVTDFADCCYLDCSTWAGQGAPPPQQTGIDDRTGLPVYEIGDVVPSLVSEGVYRLTASVYEFDDGWVGLRVVLLDEDKAIICSLLVTAAGGTGHEHELTCSVASGEIATLLGVTVPEGRWLQARQAFGSLDRFEGSYPSNGLVAQPWALADGSPSAVASVAGGAVQLAGGAWAAWYIVGFPYDAEVELLDGHANPQLAMRGKALRTIGLDMEGAGFPALGDDLDALTKPEDLELTAAQPDPSLRTIARRIVKANVGHSWQVEALGALRQTRPYPLTILGVFREIDYGGV